MDDEAAYRALLSRDERFDGRLFVGVTSTGIYCRPICRVRTPKRANCRFFASAAQAEAQAFRPCLKCRPEIAPGADAAWSVMDASRTLARQAAHHLDALAADGEPPSLAALAARLGISDRHLRRIFQAEHGVTPLQHLQTRRLLLAKQLLTDSTLAVSQVALASGFRSLRRFNAAFAESYRMSPGRLRRETVGDAGGRRVGVNGRGARAPVPLSAAVILAATEHSPAPAPARMSPAVIGLASYSTVASATAAAAAAAMATTTTTTTTTAGTAAAAAAAASTAAPELASAWASTAATAFDAAADVRVTLAYRPPYDVARLLRFFAQRAIPATEQVDVDGSVFGAPGIRRSVRAGVLSAQAGWIEALFPPAAAQVRLRFCVGWARDSGAVVAAARRWLDLDASPHGIAAVLHGLPVPAAAGAATGSTGAGRTAGQPIGHSKQHHCAAAASASAERTAAGSHCAAGVAAELGSTAADEVTGRAVDVAAGSSRDGSAAPRIPGEAGLRLPGCLDGFELAVRAVLGQQVSVAAARTLANRLVDRFGAPLAVGVAAGPASMGHPAPDDGVVRHARHIARSGRGGHIERADPIDGSRVDGSGGVQRVGRADRGDIFSHGGHGRPGSPVDQPCQTGHAHHAAGPAVTHVFPSPTTLAAAAVERIRELGIVGSRAAAIVALAGAWPELLPLTAPHRPPEPLIERLCALPGIGAWTAHYIAMRALGWPDAFPPNDVALLKAMQRLFGREAPASPLRQREADAIAQAWRPWRSYAVLGLWNTLETGAGPTGAAV